MTQSLQDEVERQTQALRTLLSERRELLANLLHDVKNPLAAVRAYADLVRRTFCSTAKQPPVSMRWRNVWRGREAAECPAGVFPQGAGNIGGAALLPAGLPARVL